MKNMELRLSSQGQNLNNNKNRNLAFGAPFVSEIHLLSTLSLPPGVFKQLNKDFIQRELIGSPTTGVEGASLGVSSLTEGGRWYCWHLLCQEISFPFWPKMFCY